MRSHIAKRVLDVTAAALGLTVLAPVLLICCASIWLHDYRPPLYRGFRAGRNGVKFRMVKLRTMIYDADRSGIDSTAADDARIHSAGRVLRRFKLDELPQLWNVLLGDMSLVGPRPNVEAEVRLYTEIERQLLDVQPGITDLSSIVFSDLAGVLAGCLDANIAYNQLVRPWKSRLGLLYVAHRSFSLDIYILYLTAVNFVARRAALQRVANLVRSLGAPDDLVALALRENALSPVPPPGAEQVVSCRS